MAHRFTGTRIIRGGHSSHQAEIDAAVAEHKAGPGFTPGPWTFSGILVECPDGLPWNSTERPIREFAANARLIAAAPELYEALKELTDQVDMVADWKGGMRIRIEVARAALAKVAK